MRKWQNSLNFLQGEHAEKQFKIDPIQKRQQYISFDKKWEVKFRRPLQLPQIRKYCKICFK